MGNSPNEEHQEWSAQTLALFREYHYSISPISLYMCKTIWVDSTKVKLNSTSDERVYSRMYTQKKKQKSKSRQIILLKFKENKMGKMISESFLHKNVGLRLAR